MSNYIVCRSVEEVKGRYEKSEKWQVSDYGHAEDLMQNLYNEISEGDIFSEYHGDDRIIIEHYPRMRTTLAIIEA